GLWPPPLRPAESARMPADAPTRRERGATYLSLHAYTDLPDVGPPQYIRYMTHPVSGVADAGTRRALARQPLFQQGPGTMQVKDDGCKVWCHFLVDDDAPEPGDAEVQALREFIETNH